MPRAERKTAIERLQEVRGGTRVISYVTSTRPQFESQMAMDAIPIIYRHLKDLGSEPEETRIDLFIHSNGGDGVVPWRLVSLLREYCSELTVLVPNRAFSAATLTALGADEVLMHPMGMLGPTDPTVTNDFNPINERQPGQLLGISVEDVASYMALVKDDVGIRHEDELVQAFLALAEKVHPLALGNVKRSTSQSRMMGEKLLKTRKAQDLDEHDIAEIIGKLSSQLFYHGHPISRREAREDLGLAFVKDAPRDVESAMWQLFEFYEEDLYLNDPFNFLHEEIRIANGPLPTPPPGQIPGPGIQYRTTRLGAYKSAYVESQLQCDVFEHTLEANVNRQWTGDYNGTMTVISSGWTVETADQP